MDWHVWIDALTKPTETLAKQKKKADFMEASKHWLLAYLVSGIIAGIVAGSFTNVAIGLMTLVSVTIGGYIFALIGQAIIYLFAKGLGGKGDFNTQFYLVALFTAPIIIVNSILHLIPVAGWILSVLLSLYGLILLTLGLKEAHKLDIARAFLAWLLPIIVGIIIAAVLAAVFLAAFAAAITGALAGIIGGGAAGGALGAVTGAGTGGLGGMFPGFGR